MASNNNTKSAKICIAGAGPAGLTTAIAFFNNGYTNVCVYEKRSDISSQRIEESYPIGVNSRGKRALKNLLEVDESLGDIVASWDVYVSQYEIRVASFKSGTVASTTRCIVVNVLRKHAEEKGIPIYYNHAVTSADASKYTVTFETKSGIKSVACDCFIVADGYRSRARNALEKQSDTLDVRQWTSSSLDHCLFTCSSKQKGDSSKSGTKGDLWMSFRIQRAWNRFYPRATVWTFYGHKDCALLGDCGRMAKAIKIRWWSAVSSLRTRFLSPFIYVGTQGMRSISTRVETQSLEMHYHIDVRMDRLTPSKAHEQPRNNDNKAAPRRIVSSIRHGALRRTPVSPSRRRQ